ncbi:hypothetical protein TWF694_010032 [Orbilia ellipsospora]|uniref:PA14 domain-containing protein n=1 Tax=Orbilia ellipsospora TaxID=2528407 RepID=A0AAV9XBS5_9PEZI
MHLHLHYVFTSIATSISTSTTTSTSTSLLTSISTLTSTETATTTELATTTTTETRIETATTTTTATTTATATPTPSQSCVNNLGLEVAIYNSPYIYQNGMTPTNDFTYFKTAVPYGVKVVDYLGYSTIGNSSAVYGFALPSGMYFALNYRGYFHAPIGATYRFNLSIADDVVGYWLGDLAYSGWELSNSNGTAYWSIEPHSTYTDVYLEAGEYLPIRIILENSNGENLYAFYVTSGNETYVDYGVPSPYLVRTKCISDDHFDTYGLET